MAIAARAVRFSWLRRGCVALAVLLLPSVAAAQADAEARVPPTAAETVTIPNFWDPRAPLERPLPAAIGPIRFLAAADFPPFAFRDRRGVLIGFDVELARALCEVLEVQCAIQMRPFDTLIEGLRDGTGNAVIAGMDAEVAAGEGLATTQTYLKIPARFMTLEGSGFDPEGGRPDKPVGVVCRTAHAAYLARFFAVMPYRCFRDASDLFAALREGLVSAAFGDALSLAFFMHGPEAEGCCRFAGGPYVDDYYFGRGLVIVLRAEDRTLKSALDYALREVYRGGTYAELYLRYFPLSLF
jgi:polar amino acid transport system substrate-binding protein